MEVLMDEVGGRGTTNVKSRWRRDIGGWKMRRDYKGMVKRKGIGRKGRGRRGRE